MAIPAVYRTLRARVTEARQTRVARAVEDAALALVILVGWIFVQVWLWEAILPRVLGYTAPLPGLGTVMVADFASMLVGVAVVTVIAWRRPRRRRAMKLVLIGSVFLLPCLHEGVLEVLSEYQIPSKGYSDFSWYPVFESQSFYGFQSVNTLSRSLLVVLPLSLVLAALVTAALRRPRLRWAITAPLFAFAGALLALAAFRGATRPGLSRWDMAYPAIASVPVEAIPIPGHDAGTVRLRDGVELIRSSPDEQGRVMVTEAPHALWRLIG